MLQCEICFKLLYEESCRINHIANKRCIEHSYRCKKCFRTIKTKVRSINDHECDEISCYNCKGWFSSDHNCYMQPKLVKKSSEKYVFFDFETTLLNNQHVINYGIIQYFDGTEFVCTNIDDFCKWAISKTHKDHTFI